MGALLSYLVDLWAVILQAFPPKPTFNVNQIPDLSGRVVIVTGGNTGIGKETVRALLQHDAKVYLAARSKEKANAVIVELKAITGREAFFLELDLRDMSSINIAARNFLSLLNLISKEPELHILFNNAGVMFPPLSQITADGYDLQFGVNVVGHFYLTKLLLPALLAGRLSSPDHHARIITTSSAASYLGTLQWETFKDGPARRRQTTSALYNQSKLANVIVARETAKRYGHQGIISIPVNPGNIQSDLQRNLPSIIPRLGAFTVLYPTPYGALTQLWAGTMSQALDYNGQFMIPWARPGKCTSDAYDPVIGEQLWTWLEEQTKGV